MAIDSEDLTNNIYGDLEVKEKVGENKWRCLCTCGNEIIATTSKLKNWNLTSCGCKKKDRYGKLRNKLEGTSVNNWDVVEYLGSNKYRCVCKLCGKEKEVLSGSLLSGKSTSCGCWQTKEMQGMEFGDWEVLYKTTDGKWYCRCKRCGKEREVDGFTLRAGLSKSCGCKTRKSLIGVRFGLLKVIEESNNGLWVCECKCGNIREYRACNLIAGNTRSCGCKTNDLYRKTMIEKYGEVSYSRKDSQRELWQIEILNNKEKLVEFVRNSLYNSDKPSVEYVSHLLGINSATMRKYIDRYEIENEFSYKKGSKYETEIGDIFTGAIKNDRSILDGEELDLYYPDKKVAIEFNGNYWHSNLYKDKEYHRKKTITCLENGIRLIHIFEYEWLDCETRIKIESLIRNALNIDVKTIYGRETKVCEISREEAEIFINDNHIQGYTNSSINIGLKYENRIVGVMTFGSPRFNNDCEYELIRLAFEKGFRVVGGAKKLFKYFIKKYKPANIVSYCDIAKFSGHVYKELEFEFVGYTEPSYVWFNMYNGNVLSRYKTMKKTLIKDFDLDENIELTEEDIMSNMGFLKIYNCGNAKYIWSKKEN